MRTRPALREWIVLGAYLVLALGLTWPLAQNFGSAIGGDYGDHWQTLWGMWWVHKALIELHQSPFYSFFVRWPLGTPLVFQTFDFTDCLLALPFWGLISPIAIFNLAELSSYVLGGYFFYRFAGELLSTATQISSANNFFPLMLSPGPGAAGPGSRSTTPTATATATPTSTSTTTTTGTWNLPAFLAGALFTFGPYHFGHALGHMQILALQWVPLYLWMLLRTLGRPERRWPLLAAIALAAASLASWYYLLFCVVLTVPYLAWRVATDRQVRSWAVLWRAALLGAAYLAVMWPLFASMLEARAAEPWDGAHDPVVYSADLQSYFVPNAAQAIGAGFTASWSRWTGNPAENCDYLGYALLALAAVGAWRRRAARIWLGIAGLGAVLALGPHLHVAGRILREWQLPYGWIERGFPLLEFTGCPVRAGFVTTLGLCAAALFGLDWLLEPGPRAAARRGAAVGLMLLAAIEFWPHPFTTSRFPHPAIFDQWAQDPTPFAVLDLSGGTRPLYNATLHGHPIVDAYLSRTPLRLVRWLDQHPVIGRMGNPGRSPPISREEGLAALQRDSIRYIIVPWQRDQVVEGQLGLQPMYAREGLLIYEVPAVGN
jgi:hypothetical protein